MLDFVADAQFVICPKSVLYRLKRPEIPPTFCKLWTNLSLDYFAKHLYFAWYVSFLFFATSTGKFRSVYVREYPRIHSVNVQVNLSELVILFSQKLSENLWFSNDFKEIEMD